MHVHVAYWMLLIRGQSLPRSRPCPHNCHGFVYMELNKSTVTESLNSLYNLLLMTNCLSGVQRRFLSPASAKKKSAMKSQNQGRE
eukprot:1158362-Pelagomonas_calceolata.AAC.6